MRKIYLEIEKKKCKFHSFILTYLNNFTFFLNIEIMLLGGIWQLYSFQFQKLPDNRLKAQSHLLLLR